MALTGPDYWRPERGSVMATGIGQACFLCERRIAREPAWTWSGATGQIFLHPGCAADFMLRIGSDLLTMQQRSGLRFGEAPRR